MATVPGSKTFDTINDVIRILELTFEIGELLLGFYFLVRLKSMQLINSNLRWILAVLVVSAMLMAIERSTFLLTTVVSGQHLLNLIGIQRCLIVRWLFNAGYMSANLSVPAATFERIMATFRPHDYSKGRLGCLGPVLSIVCVVLGILSSAIIYFCTDQKNQDSCQTEETSPILMFVINCLCFSLAVISAAVLWIMKKRNSELKNMLYKEDLNVRYQIRENGSTLDVLIPLLIAYAASVGITVLLSLSLFLKQIPPCVDNLMHQVSHLVTAAYGIFFLVFFLFMHSSFRRRLKEDMRTVLKCIPGIGRLDNLRYRNQTAEAKTSEYFKDLIMYWDRAAKCMKRQK